MTVFIVPNLRKPQAAEISQRTADILQQAGASILFSEQDAKQLGRSGFEGISHQQAIEQCDAIVTIGGDGTMLRIAREVQPFQKPLLGINLGRLGFLATCEISEMEHKLTRLAKGDFLPDRRMLLQAVVHQAGQKDCCLTALNEIVVSKGLRTQTIGLEVFCDGSSVSRYRGDGVVIATPTGSTAYSLSAGGPVVDAQIEGILLTPVCAHSLQSPPMVFSSSRRLRIQMQCESDEPIYLTADGNHPAMEISPHSTVELVRAENMVILVRFNLADQFEAIDKKLIRKVSL